MAERTPQEKKHLSLKKDRRNVYGENAKASRKNIPRRKKGQRRAERRILKQITLLTGDDSLQELGDRIKSRMASHATWRWTKLPDAPLGEVIVKKLQRRRDQG